MRLSVSHLSGCWASFHHPLCVSVVILKRLKEAGALGHYKEDPNWVIIVIIVIIGVVLLT
jgi:hypothetical protein